MTANQDNIVLLRFNKTIQQWIDFLEAYSLNELRLQPYAGSWSLGQMYTHIINDTRYFVVQMEACMLHAADGEKEMHADAKKMFAENGFPDALIEGPATNTFIPQPESREELREALSDIKIAVNKLDQQFGFARSKGKTRHPGLEYFNAGEWLQFAEMHMRHHFRQKKRIDERLAFSRRFN